MNATVKEFKNAYWRAWQEDPDVDGILDHMHDEGKWADASALLTASARALNPNIVAVGWVKDDDGLTFPVTILRHGQVTEGWPAWPATTNANDAVAAVIVDGSVLAYYPSREAAWYVSERYREHGFATRIESPNVSA